MMTITRDNYEAFFLDYLEGNLDESLIDQFLDFLEKNPDLKEELHLFENIQLPTEKTVYTAKNELYKPVASENESFELKAVAFMEGDLKDKDRLAFTAILDRNPALQKEYDLFEKTRLTADHSILFPWKDILYRQSGTIVWLTWLSRAAAILVLLLGIYTLFQTGRDTSVKEVGDKVALIKEPVKTHNESVEGNGTAEKKQDANNKILQTEKKNLQHDKMRPQAEDNILPTEQGQLNTESHKTAEKIELIKPLTARLEEEPVQIALAEPASLPAQKINNHLKVVTLDEYLASKAKKATNEGVMSVNRLLRAGLNVASELSGDRIGYTVKNGKVTSLDFESKLLAFELPLEKK